MEVVIGSYDSAVIGYKLSVLPHLRKDSPLRAEFTHRFSDASHQGCVKSVAVSAKGMLASGSTDETIRLLDLERGSDVGSLLGHDDDVTCVKFAGKDFLYSASGDGTIRMWRARIWELQRTFKGHKGSVLHFDIHPSRKLALSLGSDNKLIVWDLVAGKYSFIRNMKKPCTVVKFNKSGSQYVIISGKTLDVFNVTTADVSFSETFSVPVSDFAFIRDDLIVCGTDDGKVTVLNVPEKRRIAEFTAHCSRVRTVDCLPASDGTEVLLVTSSTDQSIKAWRLRSEEMTHELLATVATGCRITCLAVKASPSAVDQFLTAVASVEEPIPVDGPLPDQHDTVAKSKRQKGNKSKLLPRSKTTTTKKVLGKKKKTVGKPKR